MTDKQNRVAILLSTFNGERFLPAQLDSLLAQTHTACDIWLRDDGSSDGTLAIVHRYAEQYPSIRLKEGANLGFVGSFHDLLQTAGDGYDFYFYCDRTISGRPIRWPMPFALWLAKAAWPCTARAPSMWMSSCRRWANRLTSPPI